MIPEVIPALAYLPGIRAFFTTRHGGVSKGAFASLNLSFFSGDDPIRVRKNWEALLRSQQLSDKNLALPVLSHGTHLEEIKSSPIDTRSAGFIAQAPKDTDAAYTRESRWILGVTMGDCLAALIADPETRCVAAVHAGWRGSRDNILGSALRRLFSAGHCRPESTWMALGPCLSLSALELPEDITRTLPPQHVHSLASGRLGFDLRTCNQAQAIAAGLPPDHISAVEGCTRSEPERFFSYRRAGAASGRMAACIALV